MSVRSEIIHCFDALVPAGTCRCCSSDSVSGGIGGMTSTSTDDEWTVISRKKSGAGKGRKNSSHPAQNSRRTDMNCWDDFSVNIFDSIAAPETPKKGRSTVFDVSATSSKTKDAVIAGFVERICVALRQNPFVDRLMRELADQINQFEASVTSQVYDYDVVVLGVGKFTESYNALLQLSLAILLFNELECMLTQGARGTKVSLSVYDPVMTVEEVRICKDVLNMGVLLENTAGKICTRDGVRTVFYMPHCPYRLYCNVLWANWFLLEHIYIVGNRYCLKLVELLFWL
jgi:hypothetical protein